ncbi:hypothetical protein BHE74_00022478 [Ensete ventricosum]|nr:hypothetical protein BHE74_00022478 [Ensete ventricosum]
MRTVLEISRIIEGIFSILYKGDRVGVSQILSGITVFFQKDALVLLHPHCAIAPVQATAALPRGDRPYWRQGWLRVATHCGLTAGDRPYGLAAVGCAPGLAAAPMGGHTLQVAKPWPAARAGGLAVASHLCMQTACMWPPLPRRQCLL